MMGGVRYHYQQLSLDNLGIQTASGAALGVALPLNRNKVSIRYPNINSFILPESIGNHTLKLLPSSIRQCGFVIARLNRLKEFLFFFGES